MKIIDGGVTSPKGFLAAGIRAGIKPGSEKKDMAVIYSEEPAVLAGTFTRNIVKAAPVKWDQKLVKEQGAIRAVVVNTGIANACTGTEGYENTKKEAALAAELFGIRQEEVAVGSTGVIGQQLPMEVIEEGIRRLVSAISHDRQSSRDAAEAILTTDTKSKEAAVSVEIGGKEVIIGGICKGSGMIHPNMGTMLGYIATDAAIEQEILQEMQKEIVEDTFNMISVDGDTSTNDTVLVMANAMAGNEKIQEKNEDYEIFKEGLLYVNRELFEVCVEGADTRENAKILSKSVVTSSLTKAAIYGRDANWGRILCALGYSGVDFDPEKVDIAFESAAGTIDIVKDGIAADYSEDEATNILSEEKVTARINVHNGEEDYRS